MKPPCRAGAAVAVVVLVLLALQVLAHGLLLAAMGEMSAGRAAVHLLQARAAAQGGVSRMLGSPMAPGSDSLPAGAARVLGESRVRGVAFTVTAERLSREAWLLEGRGTVDGWVGSVARARLVWVMDPVARVAAFRAVAHVGEGEPAIREGSIRTETPLPPPGSTPACAPWRAALDSLLPDVRLDPVVTDTTDALRLGLLDRAPLLAGASPEAADSVTPAPVLRGARCDPAAPGNWGDPRAGRAPCRERFVFRARQGDLRLVGGVGQGLLVVTGDLSLEAGADFRGLVLVGGDVRLAGGSRLEGLVRTGGSLALADTARLLGSACWAARSLHAVRHRLDVVVPYPGWGWLTLP